MVYICVLCCSSYFNVMQPCFWFVYFVMGWAGMSFLISLHFCIISNYIRHKLLLDDKDFDISAGVQVSYFHSRHKKCKSAAGFFCKLSVSGKVSLSLRQS